METKFCAKTWFLALQEAVIKGLVIAGTKSGSGKTTLTISIMAALAKRGLSVAPFKVGPDFIDPGHHTRITNIASRNLDGWMLSKNYNLQCFQKYTKFSDIAVIEGVMGLFDGYDGKSEAGSTAQMAKWTGLPVLLVVDAKSMARSAAALVQGFENFDKDLKFAGVIFNNLGSKNHLSYLKDSLEGHVNMPCLGGIIRDENITIPERHLGLVTQNEHVLSDESISKLADMAEININLDAVLKLLPNVKLDIKPNNKLDNTISTISKSGPKIGIAYDKAFCFYYQDNFDLLKAFGAKLVYFSPINDNCLPENIDGIYLGGGYPEVFAEKLAKNKNLRSQIMEKSMNSMPIYAECGGFMYLCKEIIQKGKTFPMTGCFPFTTAMFSRLKALGYREITLKQNTIIGRSGQTIRGHEFHYSGIEKFSENNNLKTMYNLSNRSGRQIESEGYQINQTLGSYIHLHFGSQPETARHFVDSCKKYQLNKDKK